MKHTDNKQKWSNGKKRLNVNLLENNHETSCLKLQIEDNSATASPVYLNYMQNPESCIYFKLKTISIH